MHLRRLVPAGLLGLAGVLLSGLAAETVLFEEPFRDRLDPGWSWIREAPEAWRMRPGALELRVLPGNLWGSANTARNVLVRPAPDPAGGELVVTLTVENSPTEQYEQVNLAWYYDDRHMVKIGREVVDGPVCVVMGREERDQCRTLAVIPVPGPRYALRLRVRGERIRGEYRADGATDWTLAGECTLPAPAGGRPQISLHAYQGPADREHWARLTGFRITRRDNP